MPNNNNVSYVDSKNSKSMKNVKYGWLIFAFVMLFNPNIQLIDVLPDFIGFFILAKFIEKAADAAPYFEEARSAFVKLAYISLAKIPALIIASMIRSKNTLDNDIVTLFATVFTTIEIIYLIPAIKNIFDALTYLAERGNVPSLIKSDSLISTEALRSFTFTFAISKTVLYTLPEFLRLTKSAEIGTLSNYSNSRYYPLALTSSLLLGFIIGGIWLTRIIKFSKRVKTEGEFYSALEEIATVNSYEEYEKKVYYRSLKRTFIFFILSAIFSFDLTFSDYNDVNLLPSFISGILFTAALFGLLKYTYGKKMKLSTVTVAVLYNAIAFVKYVFEIKFLDTYSYRDLFRRYSETANAEYSKIEIAACFEFALYIAMTVLFFIIMKKFTLRLGKWRDDSNPDIKTRYYKEINKKTITFTTFSAIVGALSFANVFIQGSVKIVYTNATDVTMPALFVPTLPWFGLLMAVSSIAYSLYSVYYFNLIKEEHNL